MAVGAAIGLAHHAAAIQLLFWPRREVRVGGVKVPFTPGLLVAKRAELARQVAAALVDRFTQPGDVLSAIQQALRAGLVQKLLTSLSPPFVRSMAEAKWQETLARPGGMSDIAAGISSAVQGSGLVESVVVGNIDAMSSDDIEKLVLSVCDEHLRTIKLLGAPLGALIGLVQAIVSSLGP